MNSSGAAGSNNWYFGGVRTCGIKPRSAHAIDAQPRRGFGDRQQLALAAGALAASVFDVSQSDERFPRAARRIRAC